jgi:hypothetical protein
LFASSLRMRLAEGIAWNQQDGIQQEPALHLLERMLDRELGRQVSLEVCSLACWRNWIHRRCFAGLGLHSAVLAELTGNLLGAGGRTSTTRLSPGTSSVESLVRPLTTALLSTPSSPSRGSLPLTASTKMLCLELRADGSKPCGVTSALSANSSCWPAGWTSRALSGGICCTDRT